MVQIHTRGHAYAHTHTYTDIEVLFSGAFSGLLPVALSCEHMRVQESCIMLEDKTFHVDLRLTFVWPLCIISLINKILYSSLLV